MHICIACGGTGNSIAHDETTTRVDLLHVTQTLKIWEIKPLMGLGFSLIKTKFIFFSKGKGTTIPFKFQLNNATASHRHSNLDPTKTRPPSFPSSSFIIGLNPSHKQKKPSFAKKFQFLFLSFFSKKKKNKFGTHFLERRHRYGCRG